MKKIAILAALVAMAWTTPAFAKDKECVTDLKEIDAAVAKSKLNADLIDKIKKFRADGEQLCTAGKDLEAVSVLEKAKLMLGI